jgi:NAD(P)-dependent dehydrogenase (short-subunit alcohol dehydrogenase family)
MTVLDRFSLVGKVALVTGGNRGLGLAAARALGEAGASVALAARDPEKAGEATAKLTAEGISALAVRLDVTRTEEIEAAVDRVSDELGPIDVLVNNAGVGTIRASLDTADDLWERTFAANVDGVWHTSRIVASRMLQRSSGAIVNVGSIGATMVLRRPQAAYMASKAAVHQLTRALAVEWAEHGIRVNAVAPGPFSTDMTEPNQPEYLSQLPLGRYGSPDELGPAVVYLASEASSYVTGVVLTVDGGVSL